MTRKYTKGKHPEEQDVKISSLRQSSTNKNENNKSVATRQHRPHNDEEVGEQAAKRVSASHSSKLTKSKKMSSGNNEKFYGSERRRGERRKLICDTRQQQHFGHYGDTGYKKNNEEYRHGPRLVMNNEEYYHTSPYAQGEYARDDYRNHRFYAEPFDDRYSERDSKYSSGRSSYYNQHNFDDAQQFSESNKYHSSRYGRYGNVQNEWYGEQRRPSVRSQQRDDILRYNAEWEDDQQNRGYPRRRPDNYEA